MKYFSPFIRKTSCAAAVRLAVAGISLSVLAGSVLITKAAAAEVSSVTNAAPLTGVVSSGLPDAGASVFRVLGALILVIAIFLGGVWVFRNWQRFATRKNGGARLSLIEVKSLGQSKMIYVVGYQQQRMLLASSPAGVTLVSHLPDAEEKTSETAAAPATNLSFAEAFQQVLSRKS